MNRVFGVAAATLVFHLATATIYGYHRDELYYLAQSRRLAWGYADNPPLTPFLYRVASELLGTSRLALAVIPALMHAFLVVLAALIARELGGNERALLFAALGTALAPVFVSAGRFLGTVTPEVVVGAAITFAVVRIVRTGDERWWVAVGVLLGVGLLDKWTLVFFAAGLLAGLLLTSQGQVLWTWWAAGAVAIAAVIAAPSLAWQVRNGWPHVEFARHVRDDAVTPRVVPMQLALLGVSAVLALTGLWWLLRSSGGRPFRFLAAAYLIALVLVLVSGGKEYYTAAAFPSLVAAGAVACMHTTSNVIPTLLVAVGVVMVPLATPLLPLSTARAVASLNPEIGETIGWPDFVDTVAAVAAAHPGAPIVTRNYGEAGAIELLGPSRGLSPPSSGHLTYWSWGRPQGRSSDVILVGFPRAFVERYFSEVHRAATIRTPAGVENQEDGTIVWLARGQRSDWSALWPAFRRL